MSNINVLNQDNVRTIDSALDRTWDQVRDAKDQHRRREKDGREQEELLSRAICRMKNGPEKRTLINALEENPDMFRPRLIGADEAKKLTATGNKDARHPECDAFRDAIKEPVAVKHHTPQGIGTHASNMMAEISRKNEAAHAKRNK